MIGSGGSVVTEERLLTFEMGGGAYALPIAGVVEVAEVDDMACIPTLPAHLGGVINHHGDALPVIRPASLFDMAGVELPDPQHVLVLSGGTGAAARLGLPVDRVLGLVDGRGAAARGPDPVAERRPIDGRVVNLLDPQRLVDRAREVIERSLRRGE